LLSLDQGTWWNNLLRAGYGVSLLPKYAVLGETASGSLTVLFLRLVA
jgi:hypothetical protein